MRQVPSVGVGAVNAPYKHTNKRTKLEHPSDYRKLLCMFEWVPLFEDTVLQEVFSSFLAAGNHQVTQRGTW